MEFQCLLPGCSNIRWTATLRSLLRRSFSSLNRRSSFWYSSTVLLIALNMSSAAAVSRSFRNTFNNSNFVMLLDILRRLPCVYIRSPGSSEDAGLGAHLKLQRPQASTKQRPTSCIWTSLYTCLKPINEGLIVQKVCSSQIKWNISIVMKTCFIHKVTDRSHITASSRENDLNGAIIQVQLWNQHCQEESTNDKKRDRT